MPDEAEESTAYVDLLDVGCNMCIVKTARCKLPSLVDVLRLFRRSGPVD